MKKSAPKKRIEQIYATTSGPVGELRVTVDSAGAIRFGTPVENVYSEVSYARSKGPKVLSRIPQAHGAAAFDAAPALEKNFDFLCAVDTNTKVIMGKRLSAVGIVTFQPVWVPGAKSLRHCWQFDVPFCLEYVEIRSRPENFGWLSALEHMRKFGTIRERQRIGMVVDSDLGNINDYNQRKKPVDGPEYLPNDVQLPYASADAGKENIVNKALAQADSVSARCLRVVESGEVPFNTKLLIHESNGWFEGLRIIHPNKVWV
jgi:hypothetical protein